MKSALLLFFLPIALLFFGSDRAIAQPNQCDSTTWRFGLNQFAIDGNELIADLASKGWDANFFMNNLVEVRIIGATDCPGTLQYNTKLAGYRAQYLRNYFETAGYTDTKVADCYSEPERGCTPATQKKYNPRNRCVDLEVCWTKRSQQTVEVAVEPIQEPTPEPTPEPNPMPVDTIQKQDKKLDMINELEIGQTLVLEGLNFYPGSHRTLPEAKPVLKELLRIMNENPTLIIEIQGHVCCGKKPDEDGYDEEAHDNRLSWNRAKFIYDYLVDHGVEPLRLSYKGYAMKMPLVMPEVTIQDQIKNRRVEVKVMGK
jgi:outer membrane protein OmpA-like peptidoglycan-associated protein